MKRLARVLGLLIVGALGATGCATVQQILPTAAWRQARVRNEGYSLLYQLLSQESDAAKLLLIKHADPPVAAVIQEIARTCAEAKTDLEAFHKHDQHLILEMTNLPEIEQKTRAAVESTVTKELLFSSGEKFALRFLFTQAEAMCYGAHLAQVLHDQETDPLRQKFLVTIAERCTILHDRVMGLLKY